MAPGTDRGPLPLLVLANGRLGDALLASAFTASYRQWFGRPVVVVGRPETRAVVEPLVDRFVAFDFAGDGDPEGAHGALAAAVAGTYEAVLGDLHLFHGGSGAFPLLELLPAQHRIVYDGWIERVLQAPSRPWPAGVHVVPGLQKPPGVDAARRHVWHDLVHYHRALLGRLGVRAELPTAPGLPAAALHRAAALELRLPVDYVACQPQASQAKKNWPIDHFSAVFAALPEVSFVLLGGPGDRAPLPRHANVVDLRGKLELPVALAVAAGARAFVGVDSGLAHAAALAGRPTVVAMPAATPGYFFPYPDGLLAAPTIAVWSQEHGACAGCGGICAHEPLWRARRKGFPCVRALAPSAVVAALRRVVDLALAAPFGPGCAPAAPRAAAFAGAAAATGPTAARS